MYSHVASTSEKGIGSRTHPESNAHRLIGNSRRSNTNLRQGMVPEKPFRQLRPPPVPELHLKTAALTVILTETIASEIRSLIPPRLQLKENWQCVYSLDQHGVSLSTLYTNCHAARSHSGERPGFVLVLKDSHGSIFGAYTNDYYRPGSSYYGNGECFLYKVQVLEQGGIRFKAFPWTGLNDYQIFCSAEFLSIGGGDGKYGLWLDDRLESGISSSSPTFGNEPLCDTAEDGRPFGVLSVEVWKVY